MRLASRPRTLIALVAVAGVSSMVGPNPAQALRGLTGMGAEIAAGAVAAACSLRAGSTRGVDRAVHAILGLSVLVAGIHFARTGSIPWSNALIFTGKNEVGILSAFALVAVVDDRGRSTRWTVVSWGLILVSGSRAPLVAAAAASIVRLIARRVYVGSSPGSAPSRVPALAVATVAAGVVIALRTELLATLGRRPDLTGRTEIWPLVWDSIVKRPLLGGGPGGVIYEGSDLALAIERTFGRALWTTQSGYLSVVLSLGVVGAAIVVAILVSHLRRIDRLRALPACRLEVEAALSTLVVYLVINLTEDIALGHTGLFFMMYSMARISALSNVRGRRLDT